MVRSRLTRLALSFLLVFAIVGGIIATQSAAFAQNATPTPTPTSTSAPSLTLKTDFPSYSDNSGATFSFNVTLSYTGPGRKTVNLSLASPQGWTSTLTYNSNQVTAVDVGPSTQYGPDTKTLTVSMISNTGADTPVGSYAATLTATSGDLSAKLTLTAVVKAQYIMDVTTDSGILSTNAIMDKNNIFTFKVENKGTQPLQNIKFTYTGPTGWSVVFDPVSKNVVNFGSVHQIDSLGPGQSQEVEAIINPPGNETIAGDYMVTFVVTSDSGSSSANLPVRVSVFTSSIMGIVAIIIVVIIILGLVVLFWRMGRR